MAITPLPILTHFDRQRFTQFGAMDCANWFLVKAPTGKNQLALYPAMGRRHVEYFGQNKLIFEAEPRQLFRTLEYVYAIIGTRVIQIDKHYQERVIGHIPLGVPIWFDYLAVGNLVYGLMTAQNAMYIITENGPNVSFDLVTDANAPSQPLYVAAFGNRFVVSQKDTPDYYLSQFNLGGVVNPATCFTINGSPLFNRATGKVRQFGVLNNQLYIFSDYTTDILANIPSQISVAGVTTSFPWKVNTSANFNVGLADPFSLSIDFGRMVWLGQNQSGLISFMLSTGQQPVEIASQAVNVLLESSRQLDGPTPFLNGQTDGFLYQYENSIFYRASAGKYEAFGILDKEDSAHALEYNFATNTWARVVELNGERNRVQKHVFFNNKHLVSVANDGALYELAGNIYHNELRNPVASAQAKDAFLKYPMRYLLTTEQIYQEDYSEFITDYVEIDFVFGDKTFYKNHAPFDNTIFIITEDAGPDGSPVFTIAEDQQHGEDVFLIMQEGNTPGFDDNHYNQLFKPHIELFYSDDGGITFHSADKREFSPLGHYRWRMRWYELGASRNRCYKLVCVSSAPIVILGGTQNVRRASGGGN